MRYNVSKKILRTPHSSVMWRIHHPHWPLHAFPEDIAKYKGQFDEGWDALREKRFQRMVEMGIIDPKWGMSDRDPKVGPFTDEEHKEWRLRCMEVYAAMVDRMDQNIGRIYDTLERTGNLENTVIFFLSDNGGEASILGENIGTKRFTPVEARDGGPMRPGNDPSIMPGPENTYQSYETGWANLSDTPYRKFKMWMYEGGISTPLIVHWPAGITGGGEFRRQTGHVMDIMPTCCELAGVSYPAERNGIPIPPAEGTSLLPAINNENATRGVLFWEHQGHKAVRQGKWKIVAGYNSDWELYDMEADRTELNNLAGQNPGKVDELALMYDEWAVRVGVRPWDVVSEARRAAQLHMDEVTRKYREKHAH